MTVFDTISMIIIFLMIIGIFGLLLYNQRKHLKNPERPADAPIVLNLLSKFTDGKAIGTYINRKEGSNKRDHISFLPSDLYEDEIPEEKTIIINREKQLVTISKGSLSKDRSWYWILPKTQDELPEELKKDAVIGTALTTAIVVKKIRDTMIESFKAGGEAQEQLAIDMKLGELTKEAFDNMRKYFEERMKIQLNIQKSGQEVKSDEGSKK